MDRIVAAKGERGTVVRANSARTVEIVLRNIRECIDGVRAGEGECTTLLRKGDLETYMGEVGVIWCLRCWRV